VLLSFFPIWLTLFTREGVFCCSPTAIFASFASTGRHLLCIVESRAPRSSTV
jgi:hypothetical protein